MKAVVFHAIGDIRLDTVAEPRIESPTDAIVRLTASAICGTDLHMVRGTLPGMKPGTILGHEGVGIVEEVGQSVRNVRPGDRVVIPSTIACGHCAYCRQGYNAQCDNANPNGMLAGTAFFGGPAQTGPFHGLQAEYARIPYASAGLVKLPDSVDDDRAILLSDIFPTGYFATDLAEIRAGDTVAVFGCGPVGQFAICSALLRGAGRVLAVDDIEDRLTVAAAQGAEVIDFNRDHPVEVIREITGGIGVDRAIDAVGIDAESAKAGPAKPDKAQAKEHQSTVRAVAPDAKPKGDLWRPGDAPMQAAEWAVEALAKAGTLGIVGVYPAPARSFPIGVAMNKNLTLKMGNCHHRRYLPKLVRLVANGSVDPLMVLTEREPLTDVIDAYKEFDRRRRGWLKVELRPAA